MEYRHIQVKTWNLLFMYFTGVSNQTIKSILNVKKTSNLIKVISSYNICSGIKSRQAKKTICHSVPKTFDFFQNSSVPFHQVIFDHSISCVLLIDKPNESCKNSKTFERNTLSTKKKLLKKIKFNTSKDKCPNFTNLLRMPKINNSNLSNEKQKELKMKLEKHLCQLVLI